MKDGNKYLVIDIHGWTNDILLGKVIVEIHNANEGDSRNVVGFNRLMLMTFGGCKSFESLWLTNKWMIEILMKNTITIRKIYVKKITSLHVKWNKKILRTIEVIKKSKVLKFYRPYLSAYLYCANERQ